MARRSNQSILKEINYEFIGKTDAEAEAPIPWPPDAKSWLIRKDPNAGKDWGKKEKGVTEDEMARWHHWLNRHEFEQTPGDSERQGNLACCSPWDHRVGHDLATEQWQQLISGQGSVPLLLLLFWSVCPQRTGSSCSACGSLISCLSATVSSPQVHEDRGSFV